MQVNFYKTSDDKKKLNKTLTLVKVLDCKLKESCSIVEPTITINSRNYDTWMDCNIIFIPRFNRYYYIQSIDVSNDGMISISCHVDVLLTYKESLNNITALVARNEYLYSPYIEDSQLKLQSERVREVKQIGLFN